jgi:hypothetical protein
MRPPLPIDESAAGRAAADVPRDFQLERIRICGLMLNRSTSLRLMFGDERNDSPP